MITAKDLEGRYHENKKHFFDYLESTIKASPQDLYSFVNPTLIANPYVSDFPLKFFKKDFQRKNRVLLFLKSTLVYSVRTTCKLISFMTAEILFKLLCRKRCLDADHVPLIDSFLFAGKVAVDGEWKDSFFPGMCEALDASGQRYVVFPRVCDVFKNPFKLVPFFKIINRDHRKFLFDFELFSFLDFFHLCWMALLYPLMTLRLIKKEKSFFDRLFNNELLIDIQNQSLYTFQRYISGKKLAKRTDIETIYSWCEFQEIERAFNYGIRTNNSKIRLIGLQTLVNFEVYFSSNIKDSDYTRKTAPHKVFVNGSYYLQKRKNIEYEVGPSFRYKALFKFKGSAKDGNILFLGSYPRADMNTLVRYTGCFDNILFKFHPLDRPQRYTELSKSTIVADENIYSLFERCSVVFATGSGASLEAVACGLSAVIVACDDGFTTNPLVEYGRGKIWEMSYSVEDAKSVFSKLLSYRNSHPEEIKQISRWYKKNFFNEPTDKKIVEIFQHASFPIPENER